MPTPVADSDNSATSDLVDIWANAAEEWWIIIIYKTHGG